MMTVMRMLLLLLTSWRVRGGKLVKSLVVGEREREMEVERRIHPKTNGNFHLSGWWENFGGGESFCKCIHCVTDFLCERRNIFYEYNYTVLKVLPRGESL